MITINFTLRNEQADIYQNDKLLNTYGTNSSTYVLFTENIEVNNDDTIEIKRKPLDDSFFREWQNSVNKYLNL